MPESCVWYRKGGTDIHDVYYKPIKSFVAERDVHSHECC